MTTAADVSVAMKDAPAADAEASEAKKVAQDAEERLVLWGSIDAILRRPPLHVPRDAWWISVFGMWLFLIPNVLQALICGLWQRAYVFVSIGGCCIPCSRSLCSAMGSVLLGRPLLLAWTWWRYSLTGLLAFLFAGSRLGLFMWENAAFGNTGEWWHGEGIWTASYAAVDKILKSNQKRRIAFACIEASAPDLFPARLLIFMSTGGPGTEWKTFRDVLHDFFLDSGSQGYQERLTAVKNELKDHYPDAKMEDLNNTPILRRVCCKCLFKMLFNEWLDDADADTLVRWRSSAICQVLPLLIQRFLFNRLIQKIKTLRKDTVAIIERRNLKQIFFDINSGLGDYQRECAVELCDEMMYTFGLAGVNGLCAAVESVAAFLQAKIPDEAPANGINFGDYDTQDKMIAAYKDEAIGAEKYIRETLRLDPPVTSATHVLPEDTEVTLAGQTFNIPKGFLQQYVVSIANRDPVVFGEDAAVFRPDRERLNEALTWNGAFGGPDEELYKRLCPGKNISMDLTKIVIGYILDSASTEKNAK